MCLVFDNLRTNYFKTKLNKANIWPIIFFRMGQIKLLVLLILSSVKSFVDLKSNLALFYDKGHNFLKKYFDLKIPQNWVFGSPVYTSFKA